MGARIPDDVRSAVVRALESRREGRPSFREIAAECGVSVTYVRTTSNAEFGSSGAVASALAQSKNARELRKADMARQREELQARLLKAAADALDDIEAGSFVTGISFGEVVGKRTSGTTARDRQALLTAAGIALDKAKMLDQYDQGQQDVSEVGKFLRALTGAPDEP